MANKEDHRIPRIRQSPIAEDMLGRLPNKLFTNASIAFMFGLMVLFALSYIIRYPDIVESEVMITTIKPPINLVSNSDGHISKIFVKNRGRVEKNSKIMLIKSTANPEDVEILQQFLNNVNIADLRDIAKMELPQNLILGQIQDSYIKLSQSIKELVRYYSTNNFENEIKSIKNQINIYSSLRKSLNNQKSLTIKDFNLSSENLKRNKHLFDKGVISKVNLEKMESDNFKYEIKVQELGNQILTNELRIEELKASFSSLSSENEKLEQGYLVQISEDLKLVANEIQVWDQLFMLRAPEDGTVVFHSIWSKDQFAKKGDAMIVIIPEGKSQIIAKASVPEKNFGKVRIGNEVIIKLESYKYSEYGTLNGKIEHISLTPMNGVYSVDIDLPNKLTTTHNFKIPFRQEMKGGAEIVTEDLSLLERIFYQLTSINGR